MIDSFRQLNKKEIAYTWACDATNIKTRIDRTYVNKNFVKSLKFVKHIHCQLSDHLGVLTEFEDFSHQGFKTGNGIWKFNTSLLQNENFCTEIIQKLDENTRKLFNIRL